MATNVADEHPSIRYNAMAELTILLTDTRSCLVVTGATPLLSLHTTIRGFSKQESGPDSIHRLRRQQGRTGYSNLIPSQGATSFTVDMSKGLVIPTSMIHGSSAMGGGTRSPLKEVRAIESASPPRLTLNADASWLSASYYPLLTYFNDTRFTTNTTGWTQLNASVTPYAQAYGMMTYDASEHALILYQEGKSEHWFVGANATWKFAENTMGKLQLPITPHPQPRAH